MKSLWKLSAVAAFAIGGTVAQADVTLPGTNTGTGSSLVLFVKDTTVGANPNRVYARDLGLLTDAVLTQAGASGAYAGPGQAIPFTLGTFAPDSNLTAFLGGGTSFVWTIMAADTLGTQAFQQRYVTTSQDDVTTLGYVTPTNNTLRSAWSAIAGMYGSLNGALPDVPGSSTPTDGQWAQNGGTYENMDSWNGGGVQAQNNLGQAANFYVFVTSSSANLGASRVFAAVDVILSANGTLSAVATAPVPVPPALYLLGSAIAGLTGVARRKKKAKV